MRIGWIGFHQEGLQALRAVLDLGVSLAGVVTLNSSAASKRSGVGDYDGICHRYGLAPHKVKSINDSDSIELLKSWNLDVAFVLGWSQILSGDALRTARLGMIGAHASLLPKYRGSAPVNWAILSGERETGNSLIWLDEEVDAGTLIDQRRFEISPYDTCATIYDRVAESNREMVLAVLPQLMAGERPGRPQPPTSRVWPRRRPEDGLIDWRQPNVEIYNFIRGLTRPYPGAFAYLAGKKWTIWRAALLPPGAARRAAPGESLGPVVSPEAACCGQLVACGTGELLLLEIENEQGNVLKGHSLCEQSWQGRGWQRAA